jgi:hypothetical protein
MEPFPRLSVDWFEPGSNFGLFSALPSAFFVTLRPRSVQFGTVAAVAAVQKRADPMKSAKPNDDSFMNKPNRHTDISAVARRTIMVCALALLTLSALFAPWAGSSAAETLLAIKGYDPVRLFHGRKADPWAARIPV